MHGLAFASVRARHAVPSTSKLSNVLINMFLPSHAHVFPIVKPRHERLYVQNGCTVQHVHVVQEQNVPLAFDQADEAESDRVRSPRLTRRKDASRHIIQKRRYGQARRTSLVKVVDNVNVRKTLQIAQP